MTKASSGQGAGSPDDILKEAKAAFAACEEHEADNRDAALDDLKFARLGEQWPADVRRERERDGRPCLTLNRMPGFIRQVANDARQNKPSIRVHPADSAADPETAEILNGLIRNIEVTSKADVAYDTAVDFAVTMGFGYFRINTRYACDDSFDLDLVIDRVANPFSVYGDPRSVASDSSDWNVAFVTDLMPKDAFEAAYKGADPVDWKLGDYAAMKSPWRQGESVMVAEWWTRERTLRTVVMLTSQEVMAEDVYRARKDELDALGVAVAGSRQVESHTVTQRILTGAEVLETRAWPGRYIPIVPVYGDELNVEGKRCFQSLIRAGKDAQRNFNYWRTAATELVALAPKAPFIGPAGAFETDASKWATANTESHAYIEYDGATPPQRQAFAGIPARALQEAANAADDMKAVIGLYDASLGAQSNEISGVAISARQREGDVSTFHFIDNLSRAIEHGGRVLIDLIPHVYSGERTIRTLGAEGEQQPPVPLGTPTPVPGPDGRPMAGPLGPITRTWDLSVGKYDLTVETGPSFTTRRQEAATQMTELVRAFPQAAPVVMDLIAKYQDWPGADEIARRLRAMLPPQVQGLDPNVAQAQQQTQALRQQASQQIGQLQAQLQAATQRLQQLEADQAAYGRKLDIDAFRAETERMKAIHEVSRGVMGPVSAPGPG